MGTITRTITNAVTFGNGAGNTFIPYSRRLVSTPLEFVSSDYAPIAVWRYTYIDAEIEGATPDNEGEPVDGGYQITFNTWDIDAIYGVRVGDRMDIESLGFDDVVVKDVKQVNGQLIVLLDATAAATTDITGIVLFPVGRGNFGPVVIEIVDQSYTYQPPTTYESDGNSLFVVDASEAAKSYFAMFPDVFSPQTVTCTIKPYLDGSLEDPVGTDNLYNAALPCLQNPVSDEFGAYINYRIDDYYATTYPVAPEQPIFWPRFSFPNVGTVDTLKYQLFLDEGTGEVVVHTLDIEGSVDCNQLEILALDSNWLGLIWQSKYGGYDVWFFKYGQRLGPQHAYIGGDSQMQRVGYNISQTNRGITQRSWQMTTGQFPKKYSPLFAGLKEATRVWLIPNPEGLTVSIDGFFIPDPDKLISVYVQDDDWTDNVFGEALTNYSVTVVEQTIGTGYQQ